jgi:CRP-like cAMP-binding protein
VFSDVRRADAVYFVQTGKVKIAVVSASGKEAILRIAGPGEFFGESSLARNSARPEAATALEESTIVRIETSAMWRALHELQGFAEVFVNALVVRNIRLTEDLCDQFFNRSERRLARVLTKLAELAKPAEAAEVTLPPISHETLAEMVGTTRPRVTHFMNKFRKRGFVNYRGGLTIRPGPLRKALLRD